MIRAFPRCGIGWSADNSTDEPAFSTSLTRGDGRFCFLRAMCADRTARSSGVVSGSFARSVPVASDDEFIIRCFYTYFRCTARYLGVDIRRVRPPETSRTDCPSVSVASSAGDAWGCPSVFPAPPTPPTPGVHVGRSRTQRVDAGAQSRHLHHADDASSFVRTARADRSCSIASAAALMAAVTTR